MHWESGLWAGNGGYELPLLLGMVGVAVAFTGPGQLSLDRGWSWARGGLAPGLASIALGVVTALIVLAVRLA